MNKPFYTVEYDTDEDSFSVMEDESTTVFEVIGPHRAADKHLCELLAAALNEGRVVQLRSLQELSH